MSIERAERKLAAILAADVEGYSRLMGCDEVSTLRTLTEYRQIADALIAQGHGRIFNTAGDSVLAEFPSVVDAVQCAVEVQKAVTEKNANKAPDRQMRFRIGVHVGDVLVQGENLFGHGVNVAARLESIAQPGGICVSAQVRDYLGNKLPVTFTDRGEQAIKNIASSVHAYDVRPNEGAFSGRGERPALALPDKPSIAVLPFLNMSADREQEYFADGIVEDMITALSRVKWLFVIARNSTFIYKGATVDVRQVGRELGVRYVLEGSVRKASNRVRITAQLLDASMGAHLWAERFDGALDDIFELQDQVTGSVVGAIAPQVERAEIERSRRKPTANLDAYDYYLRGRAEVEGGTKQANEAALQLFYRAIDVDPAFASAYAMAARCYTLRKANAWMNDASLETDETRQLARRAIELGKNDAVALCFAGFALARVVLELDNGAALIDRALTLNPHLAAGWQFSGLLKAFRGEAEPAIEHLARAMRLSPLDPGLYSMQTATALAHFIAGRYDDAAAWAQKAIQESPAFLPAVRIAASSWALGGRLHEARRAAKRMLEIEPAFRIANLKDHVPLRRPEDAVRYAEGLRKAGIPD